MTTHFSPLSSWGLGVTTPLRRHCADGGTEVSGFRTTEG